MMTNDLYKKKDEQLFAEVQKLKDGDFSNSNAVYELSEKYIYKIINDIVKNHHTTEDLMQEAYIQIYNKIGTLQEVKAFYIWAGRIATNLTLRYIQKNSKEVLATADEEGDTDFIFDTASEDNEKFIPESVLVDREKQRLIAEIIDKLSTEQKICIQYFYYEEMSVNQIAEAMGCSTGTIKSRLNYARKSIKEAVVELDEKHGTRLYSLASAPLFLIIFRAAVEGLLPAAVAGAASAAAVGGASVVSGVSTAGNAASVGGASVTGSTGSASTAGSAANAGTSAKALNTASIAEKSVLATEKGPSTSRIEEVKNLVLEKLKKAGTDLKADAKKAAKAAKEMGKANSEVIKAAFETGKKEGFKQILQSAGIVLGTTAKGFVASTLATKVVTLTVAGVLVATPIMNGGGMGGNETAEFVMHFQVYYSDNGTFYEQFRDEINAVEVYPIEEVFLGAEDTAVEEDILIDIFGLNGYDLGICSDSTALSESDLHELISYGLQFKDCKGEIKEGGAVEYEASVNHEIIIEYNGEKCLCSIEKVSVYTVDANMEEYRDAEDMGVEINYKKGHGISLSGTFSSIDGKKVEKNSDTPMDLLEWEQKQNMPSQDFGIEENGNEVSEDIDTEIDITDPKYATTYPGAAEIADPSEIEGITVPELEAKLPTVEAIREIEQMQTILYVEYSRTNMTDEVFYSLMEQVPCTVYLQDESSHSVTLAEFIFKDWSSYADLDKLDYDSNKARELSEGYKTTIH